MDASRGLPLAEEQICYQVTTQGKEHTNAEQPPWHPAWIDVVGDHGEDGDGPEPIEPWHVALGTPYRLRHDGRPASKEHGPILTSDASGVRPGQIEFARIAVVLRFNGRHPFRRGIPEQQGTTSR